jgi:ankyrin repeat protein
MKNNIIKLTRNNDIEGVKKMIAEETDINIQDKDGRTALMEASEYDRIEIIKFLIEEKANLNIQDKKYGWTALIFATFWGRFEIVKLLIEAKADVNIQDKDGWTALMYASFKGLFEIAKILVEAKADQNLQDENGKTALDYAKEQGNKEIVELLTPAFSFLKLPKYITSRHWFLKPTLNLYVYLLSQATYQDKTTINNIVLNKHQILTSSKALESALKLTRTEVRTALEHLKKTGDIKITTTNKYSIITLLFEGSINNKNFEKESLPIADIINKIAKLLDSDEIEIEIVGSWLWISGDSKQYKNEIKEAGFRFSGAKKMWFYCCKTEYKASKTNIDIDKLRLKYGSEILKNKSQLQEWFLNAK